MENLLCTMSKLRGEGGWREEHIVVGRGGVINGYENQAHLEKRLEGPTSTPSLENNARSII